MLLSLHSRSGTSRPLSLKCCGNCLRSLRPFAREVIKYDGNPPPEVRRLIMEPSLAQSVRHHPHRVDFCAHSCPFLGLFWLAFTTYPGLHPSSPPSHLAQASLTLVAYCPIAASAMASNSALRSAFAAACSLVRCVIGWGQWERRRCWPVSRPSWHRYRE